MFLSNIDMVSKNAMPPSKCVHGILCCIGGRENRSECIILKRIDDSLPEGGLGFLGCM